MDGIRYQIPEMCLSAILLGQPTLLTICVTISNFN